MRRLLPLAITLLFPVCLSLPASAASSSRPPNFVFILGDDLGTPPISAYGSGYYRTPHIDTLARDGIKFTAAYAACPVCSWAAEGV